MSLAFRATTALTALLLLPLLFSAAGAQQQARACLTKDEEPPPGGLPNTPPVFFDKPQIVHKQKSYYVKIFSDTAPKPGQRFDQCFRYEAENEGPDPINAFYWELANGLWVDPMLKAERHSRKVVRPVDDEPKVMPTRVTAFENDSAQTQAWTVVPRRTAAASAPFQWVWPESIAGLPEFLQTHNLPPRPLTAFYLKETGATASTLEDVYSGPRINIALRSDARRSGNEITIRTEVVARGEASTEARYFMPALRALRPLERPANVEAYDAFFRRYVELRPQSSSYQPRWDFPLDMPAASLSNDAVYRIFHPIGIEYKGQHVCFLAASYAPLPVSLSANDCPSWFRGAPR